MASPRLEASTRVAEAHFPPSCGVYVLWGGEDAKQPLYVGVAATQTIEQRWKRQHLRSRAGGSALRRSLAVELGLVERKLNVRTDGRFYAPEVEEEISTFLRGCRIAFVIAATPEEARRTEVELIRTLHPKLNVRR